MNTWSDESKLDYDNVINVEIKKSNNSKFISDKSNKYIDETYINHEKKNVTVRKWRVKIV